MGQVWAVVPAAGSGRRMGGGRAKQFLALGGLPILARTLLVLERTPEIEAVVVVAPPDQIAAVGAECVAPFGLAKPREIVPGGAERQDSVARGLAVALAGDAELVAVHDAARPLASPALIARVVAAARQDGAAIAALPVNDTVKEAGAEGSIAATRDRSRLWLAQTPQAFRAELLARAHAAARARGLTATDEAGLVEALGEEVKLVMGEASNLKITTPADLALAEALLAGGGGGGGGGAACPRVGQGLDFHRLVAGQPLILGGVRLDYPLGLLGHSDADVLTHAVMDALLAAAGLGDIGRHFPDSDPTYRGADSLALLGEVVAKLAAAGWRPVQVTATLVAQRPKIAPHAPAMRANLARVLGLMPSTVNLAATTSEGLGFAGRGEGMAALATATLLPLAPLSSPPAGPGRP